MSKWARIKGRGRSNITLAKIMREQLNRGSIDIHDIIESAAWVNGMCDREGKIIVNNVSIIFYGITNEVINTRNYTKEEATKIDWNNFFDKHCGRTSIITIDANDEECTIFSKKEYLELIDDLGEDLDHIEICEKYYGQREVRLYTYTKGKVYVNTLETNHSFDGFVWSHGLAAYNAGGIVENAINIVDNPEWEICCAFESQNIGPIGLYITGDAKVVSNIDLYSDFDERGRYFDADDKRSDGIISHPDEIDKNKWDHGEAILTNCKIIGLWVKDWYVEKGETVVKELEDEFGFKAVVVEARRTND